MPKEQYEPVQTQGSIIDIIAGGGDAVGTIGFFLNPFIAFGEEAYHGIKDSGYKNDEEIKQMMKEIDDRANERTEKRYKNSVERKLNKEAYRKLTIENEMAELQYERGKWQYAVEIEQYQSKAKSKASRKSGTSRRKSGRTTGNDRGNITVKVESNNTNVNDSDYLKKESPEEATEKIKQYVR